MVDDYKIVDIEPETWYELPCCGVKNPKHDGRKRKMEWSRAHFPKGWKAKILQREYGQQLGYLEYLPGRYAWRGVEAEDYMFIHCIWIHYKQDKGKGYGQRMLQTCIQDARETGMNGVAVIAREKPWLANKEIFLKNGFESVDILPPDYSLLAIKFKTECPAPRFKTGWEEKLKKYGKGLTIIRSDQCPHIAKFADDIAQTAVNVYGLKPRIIEIGSSKEAQNAPTPYAVFSLLYDGRILADHQISNTRFKNIMNTILEGDKS